MPASHSGIAADCYKLSLLEKEKLWKEKTKSVKICALRGSQVRKSSL